MVINTERPVYHRYSQSVAEDPNVSIPPHYEELGLSYGTLWHIMHLGLQLHPYKVQFMQQLKPA